MMLFHIDTDMGVDDALALVVASRLPDFTLRAVSTVFGNVPVEVATRNTVVLRHLLPPTFGYEVIRGADRASDGLQHDARHVHGDDGLGGATSCLDQRLWDAVSREAEMRLDDLEGISSGNQPVTLIALGPTTNIPRLVKWYGPHNVARIVIMAGAFFDRGNFTAWAEFNAYCDPAALQATLSLGIPTVIVPLDVCRKIQLLRSTVLSYLQLDSSDLFRLIVDSHMKYMDFYRDWEGIDGCFPHDTVAVLAATNPELFFQLKGTIRVDLSPELRGRTSLTIDPRSHVQVVMGGDLKFVRKFLGDLPLIGID